MPDQFSLIVGTLQHTGHPHPVLSSPTSQIPSWIFQREIHWSRHLRTSVELLRRSFATAQEAGDFKYAVYTCDRLVMLLLAAGDPLGEVQREAENGLRFERTAKFGFIVQSRRGTGQISMPKVH